MSSQALVLVGHGSHLSADSSAPVEEHAGRIREAGAFDEVLTAYWKEEPELRYALDLVESASVFVVPLFLAEGYFTRRIIPRELGIAGPVTRVGDRVVHYCRPVGAHPAMAGMIQRRAVEGTELSARQRLEAALVIIGHGTERSATSGDTVYRLVEEMRAEGGFARVECGFLDEDPRIGDVVAGLDLAQVVLVPFFVADGWHTRVTIPEDLGISGSRTESGGRTLHYTQPVGTIPEIADVVLAIAREAGAAPRASPHRD